MCYSKNMEIRKQTINKAVKTRNNLQAKQRRVRGNEAKYYMVEIYQQSIDSINERIKSLRDRLKNERY